MSNQKAEARSSQLTLAAMYLEGKLNEGLSIEIPSLGIAISKKSSGGQEVTSLTRQMHSDG